MDADDRLGRLAARAVRELKRDGKWDGREEGFAYKCGADPDTSRAAVLYILRGESPQAIFVELDLQREWKKSIARSCINEIKAQIESFFTDDNRYDWPEGFSLEELRRSFPRLLVPWSADENLCLNTVARRLLPEQLSEEQLAAIFQRPSQSIRRARSSFSRAAPIDDSRAVNFLGASIRCENCSHATILKYATLEIIAARTSVRVFEISTTALREMVAHFRCQKCNLKTAVLLL